MRTLKNTIMKQSWAHGAFSHRNFGRTVSGGSRKKYLGGGPGPSSFGRQPRLSEITTEAISGVLLKFRWVYARNVAPSSER